MTEVPEMLEQIQHKMDVSKSDLANWVGTSLTSIIRWEQSNASPSPAQLERIGQIYLQLISGKLNPEKIEKDHIFASTGVHQTTLPLFIPKINPTLTDNVDQKLFDRITNDYGFTTEGNKSLSSILDRRIQPASTNSSCPKSGMSAGKNTYTYDAHTYHTKMPPQGIAELLKHYLPEGGLVLDPFAGSGMTGVAARALGYDVILNELSPAACFISNQFTSYLDSNVFLDAVNHLLNEVADIRHSLYTTHHRDTGKLVELEYLVWSYSARCHHCGEEFVVWNHCREYGNNVKEHKIRSKFPCPCCHKTVKKSSLIRTQSAPVMVAYRNGNSIRRYPLDDFDYSTLEYASQEELLHKGFYPQLPLYEGINLNQPIRHGIDRIDKFYTARNLLAMNRLWYAINRFENDDIASFLAFVFTSLYQRVTRLSEFRFWGGSGNTARFNVPFIFKEANVFTTFERKAKSIHAHLQTTASRYTGQKTIINGTATDLHTIPDNSIDLIFTDPPFGSNINYSEMNILWEAWLEQFTDNHAEAIINKYQKKGIDEYGDLMAQSLRECWRVLRPGHWMLMVFMNSSQDIWDKIREAIQQAGFSIIQVDIFDKQHSTFKQLVSDNTTGSNLVIHCQKTEEATTHQFSTNPSDVNDIINYLKTVNMAQYSVSYIHVNREDDINFSQLYGRWIAYAIENGYSTIDFPAFREIVLRWINEVAE